MAKLIKPRYINRTNPIQLMCFGEAPGADEVAQGTAFVGAAGKHLDDILKIWQEEIPGLSICLDNPYAASDRVNIKPNRKDLELFKDYVHNRIKEENPKVIVALGEVALRGLGIDAKPLKSCGLEFSYDTGEREIPVVGCVHPSYDLRVGGKALPLYRLTFATVKKLIHKQRDIKVQRIDGVKDWYDALKKLEKDLCAVDLETDGLTPRKGGILLGSVSNGKTTIWTPLYHKENTQQYAIEIDLKQRALMEFWNRGPRIAQNVKHELKWFRVSGGVDPTELYDTMLQAYLINANEPRGLDHLAVKYCGAVPWWLRIPKGVPWGDIPLDILGPYCGNDSLWTHRLHLKQLTLMPQTSRQLCQNIIIPLAKLLPTMETRGVHCDRELLEGIQRSLQQFANVRTNRLSKTFPGVNFNSNPQMTELLFNKLALPVLKRSKKTRNPSADADTIEKLAEQEPKLQTLVEARQIANVQSKMETWNELLDSKDLLHTDYTLGYVVTGRLSSTDPNLQNVDRPDDPSRPWKGIQRRALTSRHPAGHIVQLDFSQHELRVYTGETGDKSFTKTFLAGIDVHTATAAEMHCERPKAKNINFSVLYIITPNGLTTKYGLSEDEGVKLILGWHEVHPELKLFYKETCEFFLKHGYVETMFGHRYVPHEVDKVQREVRHFLRHLMDDNFYYFASHEIRQLINVMIQGPAVFCSYIAMPFIEEAFPNMLVHQIHDSVVLDVPEGREQQVARQATKIMNNIDLKPHLIRKLKGVIPLKAEAKISVTL